jgi:UDP-glucose 4-epimerase
LIVGDILDPGCLGDALTGCDVVFHLAARVAIRASFTGVVEDTTTNVVGTASVLQAAHAAGVRKVITTSSMAVYADAAAPVPLDEHYPTEPISPYGISKLAAERLTHTMCAQAGMQSVVLRLFNTYGPGQALSPYVGVVTIFVNALRQGKPPTIFGDGAQCRDFVHVADVVQGFVGAMEADVSGETFNIGTGVPTSVNTVLRHLNRVMQTSLAGRYSEAVAGELRYSIADIRKAHRMLGYAPQHRFETAIETVVRDIVAIS